MKKIISIMLAVLLLAAMPVTAFAKTTGDSAERVPFKVEVSASSTGKGAVKATDADGKDINGAVLTDGDVITLTATPENGSKFAGWVISGEYEIVEGDLNSSVLKIKVKSSKDGVSATANFALVETTTSTETTVPPTTNGSGTSPDTGVSSAVPAGVAVAVLGLAGVACITAAKKKERD